MYFVILPIMLDFSDSLSVIANQNLQFRVEQMAGQFSAHIWTSIWAGFIIGFPYVLYELWKFISPGLHDNERKNSRGFIFIASSLFF